MISIADRRHIVKLIDIARHEGARLYPACTTIGISARTYQRWTAQACVVADGRPDAKRPVPANKLTPDEAAQILGVCVQPEYASLPPGQIVPRLADEGRYIGSESSFYRLLTQSGLQHHRGRNRKPARTPAPTGYCAQGPNQVWSWDVTWLSTPIRGMFYYLYMIVDVYSRKITGWEVQPVETGELASRLLKKAVLAEGCQLDPPVLHADNGAPQRGSTLRATMDALGVTPSFSRPRVSNDNPYSESLFRTLKYRPAFPEKGFLSIDEARKWVAMFVEWYNESHLHSQLCYVTPGERHRGEDTQKLAVRHQVYQLARERNPQRWTTTSRNWSPVGAVWLNKPADEEQPPDQLPVLSPDESGGQYVGLC